MSLRKVSSILLGALALAAVGCTRPAKPATVVPPSPAVLEFSASQTRVPAGTEVTLSWKTENASSISLSEATTGAIPGVAADAFESSAKVTVNATSVYVLTARGEAGSDTRLVTVEVPGSGASVLFRALPDTVQGGEVATLVWSAPGYGAVTIKDDSGAAVPLAGQTESGSVAVTPSKTTAYTLTVAGQTLTVTVKVTPAILGFSSDVATANPGDKVNLSWTTSGASKVTLTAAGRGELTSTTTAAEMAAGTFQDTIPATLPADGVVTYTLTVDGEGGSVSKPLTLYVSTGIDIDYFTVQKLTKAGASVPLTWKTTAADSVQISVDGLVLYQSPTPSDAAQGSFFLTAPAANFSVTLTATNSRGGRAEKTYAVDVVTAPTSATLTSDLSTANAGDKVMLTWAAPNARHIVITGDDGFTVKTASGFQAEAGTVEVYPHTTTTYTLTADDTLGDPAVTATAQVTVTGSVASITTFPRGTLVAGPAVQLSYGTDSNTLLYGLPHTVILPSAVSNFVDISQTGNRLNFGSAADDETTTFDPGFDTYLFSTRVTGTVSVSMNGFLSWSTLTATGYATEKTFPNTSTNVPANTIAPYWDDLKQKTTSGIYWQVIGDAPERRLIVQWDDFQVNSDTSTTATFQAQISQTGEVVFSYKTMVLPSSASFTAGVQGGAATLGLGYTVKPVSNSAVYFFSPIANGTPVKLWPGVTHNAFVKIGNGYLYLNGPSASLKITDLSVTEVMAQPAVANGQYVELRNRSGIPVDLTDWKLVTSSNTSYSFDGGTIPADGGFLVVGQTTDRTQNDDAGVDIAWDPAFSLPSSSTGAVSLSFLPDAGVGLDWTGLGGTGVSAAYDDSQYLFSGSSTPRGAYCSSIDTFGSQTPPQKGNPGGRDICGFGYVEQSIPVGYYDISAAGSTRVFNANVDTNINHVVLPSTAAPFPYIYGAQRGDLWVSANGFLLYNTTSSSPSAGNGNDSYPSATSGLSGTLAILWDDLANSRLTAFASVSDVYYKRTAQGEDPFAAAPHWIFQWHHFSYWTPNNDDMNFEIKIFDDGTIEYHYATMLSGNTSNHATGLTATEWLSNPGGTQALSLGVNQAVISSDSAYRFTPH